MSPQKKADHLAHVEIEKRRKMRRPESRPAVPLQKKQPVAQIEIDICRAVPPGGHGDLVQHARTRFVQDGIPGVARPEAKFRILHVSKVRCGKHADNLEYFAAYKKTTAGDEFAWFR